MPSANETELQIQARNGKIFSPIRQKWLEETPCTIHIFDI